MISGAPVSRYAPTLQNREAAESSQRVSAGPVDPHIFLSHSGYQKGFVKDLYAELHGLGFSSFFDIAHHSLPLAESFPPHILRAAKKCKLAVVILSEEFVSSKWPMTELSAFVEAMPTGVKILPLFYRLSRADLSSDRNLARWSKAWKAFSKRSKHIDRVKWAIAIKTLRSQNGLKFNDNDGERAYLRQVVTGICEIVPPKIIWDTSRFMHGTTRISQVILEKFQKIEDRDEFPSSKATVLGLYGIPGSGKSTLCKCLCADFFRIYAGKTLHLDLPTRPSASDLVHEFKKLFCLTNFRDTFALDKVSNMEEVLIVLERYQLSRCRVFLAIDNISDQTLEAVQMLLHLGFGPGSKVVLVAHTYDILKPAFLLLKRFGQRYIYDHTCIPSINEAEAIRILLQHSGVGTCEDLDGQRVTIARIVRMCNFGSEYHPLYLPLVMKTMGAMLINYKGDWDGWGNDLGNFWASVATYKEKAVQKLVANCFIALRKQQLQLLFLDLALFILPLSSHFETDIYSLISNIYDGMSEVNIEMMIKDLERHCFLICSNRCDIKVHDVYMEFARSVGEGSSTYIGGFDPRICWENHTIPSHADEGKTHLLTELGQSTGAEHRPVRAMILEVGDGCERVDLQGFSSLKAMAVKNCKSLRALGLAGLSSLRSLDILECSNLRQIEWSDDSNLCKVKRLRILCSEGDKKKDVERGTMFWHAGQAWIQKAVGSPSFFKWLPGMRIAPERSSLEMGIAKMRWLQVLHIGNTGITRLGNMSSCWPQLRDLIVNEPYLEKFEMGNLPNLKRFHFNDYSQISSAFNSYYITYDKYRLCTSWKSKRGDPRFLLQGKGLLEGCPQLEHVIIESGCFEEGELGQLPPNLRVLKLNGFYPAKRLPDLSSAAHTLERVELQWCAMIEKATFNVEFGKLTKLRLVGCASLMKVTGLGFLSSLWSITISDCCKLQAVLGLDSLSLLQFCYVNKCPELRTIPSFSGLNTSLESLCLVSCPKLLTGMAGAGCILFEGMGNLVKLKCLELKAIGRAGDESEDCEALEAGRVGEDFAQLQEAITTCSDLRAVPNLRPVTGLVHPLTPLFNTNCSWLHSLETLTLQELIDVASMHGVFEQLQLQLTLKRLTLKRLENLRCLRGLESLIYLEYLSLDDCPLLEEMPSVQTLVNLHTIQVVNCPKLRTVEGCDAVLLSGRLKWANFDGCKSLVCLPLSAAALTELERIRPREEIWITFKGCKFARIDEIKGWAMNGSLPSSIREASLDYLEDEDRLIRTTHKETDHVEAVRCFPLVLNDNDNDCPASQILSVIKSGSEVQQNKQVGGLPEEADLLQPIQPDVEYKLSIISCQEGGLPKLALLQQIQTGAQCKLSILSYFYDNKFYMKTLTFI